MNGNLFDYIIHYFGGKAGFLQLIGDRNFKIHTGKQAFFDKDFNAIDFTFGDYPPYLKEIKKTKYWTEMLTVAEKLSQDIDYCRVDLYEFENKIYFGEITCTPTGGNTPNLSPKSYDLKLGEMIRLAPPAIPTFIN